METELESRPQILANEWGQTNPGKLEIHRLWAMGYRLCRWTTQQVANLRHLNWSAHLLLAFAFLSPAAAQDKITFQEHVLPLVEANCSKCHNPDKKKADLDLTSFQAALKGSGSGAIVLSGNPDGSKLWKALNHAEEPFMPPNRPKLSDKELEVFKKWIAGGLLENASGKPMAVAKSGVDLQLKLEAIGKPEGPPPMPQELPLETAVHTARGTAITGLAASPWAPLAAVAGQKQVLLFNTDTLELAGILPFPEGQPAHLKFSQSGKLLLASGGDAAKSGRVVLWDVITGEPLLVLSGEERDTVLAADIRPDQSQLALGGPGRLVKICSIATGEILHKIKKHTDWVTAIAFSPNGQMLATADRNGGISIWDPDSAQELFTLAGHKGAVSGLNWRPDSKLLASSSEDGTVKLWDLKEGREVKSWTAHGGGALCVNYASDGQLVTCGRDNAVTLWSADGGNARRCEFFGNIPIRAVFTAEAKRIVATDFDGRVAVWTAADQKRVGELNPNPVPFPDQIAAAQKTVDELLAKAGAASNNIAAAEAEVAKASGASAEATKALETARADQAARQAEVTALSQQLTNAPPDLPTKLAAASTAWGESCSRVTNANAGVEARHKESEAANAALAKAKSESPDAALAQARSSLAKLQATQGLTAAWQIRQTVSAKKRELGKITSVLETNRKAAKDSEQALAAAKAAASQAEAQLKTSQAEVARDEPAATQLAADLAAQQAKLDALLNQYRNAVTNAAAPPVIQATR